MGSSTQQALRELDWSGFPAGQVPPAAQELPLLALESEKARHSEQGPLLHVCPASFTCTYAV